MKQDDITFFELKAGRYNYYLTLTIKYDYFTNNPTSYGFDIGGKMKGCVRITVDALNPELEKDDRFKFLDIQRNNAYISHIGYNKMCSIDGSLMGGDGTRHMIRTATTIVCVKCPWVKTFTLNDTPLF